jgi:N6-L-threonylcarbamoyladenine synthase
MILRGLPAGLRPAASVAEGESRLRAHRKVIVPDSLLLLAIETTCDETGAAVLEGPSPPATGVPRVRSSVVASQVDLHERFGGVVPEIASREHVRQLLPVVDEALKRAGVELKEIGAIAVATRPGLVGSLVVGLTAAKTLAMVLDVPLVAVDHLEAHLYACQLANPDREVYPCVGLVVSGGHTSLFECRGPIEAGLLGGTIDDAAGEAFDKVASLLGLGYPGGPEVERVARSGDPKAFDFPRAFLRDDRLDFSFSGLKTAVLYALRGQDSRGRAGGDAGIPAPEVVADLAASFQEAVVDVLVSKCRQAMRRTGIGRLGIGGGVAANGRFRERVAAMAVEEGAELFVPPMAFCTDNAAMLGVAFPKLAAGQVADLDVDVTAGLVRPSRR